MKENKTNIILTKKAYLVGMEKYTCSGQTKYYPPITHKDYNASKLTLLNCRQFHKAVKGKEAAL